MKISAEQCQGNPLLAVRTITNLLPRFDESDFVAQGAVLRTRKSPIEKGRRTAKPLILPPSLATICLERLERSCRRRGGPFQPCRPLYRFSGRSYLNVSPSRFVLHVVRGTDFTLGLHLHLLVEYLVLSSPCGCIDK